MTYEQFQAEVSRAENILAAMRDYPMQDIPNVDFNIEACECAAVIGGFDATTAKMLNKQFRNDAARVARDMAKKMVRQ